jgi:hypothetical protein
MITTLSAAITTTIVVTTALIEMATERIDVTTTTATTPITIRGTIMLLARIMGIRGSMETTHAAVALRTILPRVSLAIAVTIASTTTTATTMARTVE